MSNLKISVLLSVLTCLSGCGHQVVQFPLDGADAGVRMDAGTDDADTDDAGTDPMDPDAGLETDGDPLEVRPVVISTLPEDGATAVPTNYVVFASFSKPMDAATINTLSFTVTRGASAVDGSVTWNALTDTATFRPMAALAPNTVYTATITSEATDTEGLSLEENFTWAFTTAVGPAAQRVVFTTPLDGATDVAVTIHPTATFSGEMDAASLNGSTFTVTQGGTLVPGVVTYAAATNTATFSPAAALDHNLVYIATVTTGAMDTTGLPLAADYSWQFTTNARPGVISTLPVAGSTAVPLNDSVFATFSRPMDADTINALTFTLTQGATEVGGAVTWNALTNTATLNPNAALVPNALHRATITTGATDPSGLSLAENFTWTFTTAAGPAAPRVVFTTPVDDATNVAVTTRASATFSGAMDATTINGTTFSVRQGVTPVSGSVTYNAPTNTATFSPSAVLNPNLVYTATVTTGAEDTSSLALGADYSWDFTTTVRPTVVSTLPANGASSVPPTDSVFATFSKAMDAATINTLTFTLTRGATAVPGAVTWNALTATATFNPTAALLPNAVHTATITTGARDTGGLAATSHTWTFTTAIAPTPPTVAFSTPLDDATNVPVTSRPTATFNRPMDATTINASTFTVGQGATSVPGVVTYNAATNTATFSPSAVLNPNLVYTATVTTGARDATGLALAANASWDFTTAARPTVLSTVPATGATGVPPNDSVFATFSKAMDAATINAQTFTLRQGAANVPGVVSLNAVTNTATFNPTATLSPNLPYTATITTGARDAGGLALAANFTWTFTTAAAPVPPTVTLTTPSNLATNVPLSANLTATFSRAMDASTITALTFTVMRGATPVPGVVTYNAATNTATLNPTGALAPNALHTATVTTGARDTAGLALAANYVWTFTTAPPLTVLSTTPLNNAVNVSVNARPTARFSQPMNPATITGLTFTLRQGLLPVSGTVSFNAATNIATFTPLQPLGLNLPYTATITTGARDATGSALASDFSWVFTTSACSQLPVALRSAANFVVLAGSTVTNTGPTSVTGDLGVSPGTAITGFLPGIVIGSTHAGNPTSAQAIADLTIAYNDAAGRVLCPVTIAGNLGGMTLAPGLYKSTSSLGISSGDLTLDAQGDGEAIFIFQMASTFTTSAGRSVILANGAKAANIYWQVGTSATLGTTSVFHGTIMADQAITLGTGATLNGRALARIAAVALDSNVIVKPAP